MDGKVNAVIPKAFGVGNYESEVRISKFKTADPIWQSRIQYFSEFWIFGWNRIENSYSEVSVIGDDGSEGRI